MKGANYIMKLYKHMTTWDAGIFRTSRSTVDVLMEKITVGIYISKKR